ncbi:MAG: class I SAM-dependent methyltransferase [Lachnospiraceae bacterium]|nr:class I SAM-dependent methyltransferase [Lachnospiraceae bacterium]
MITEKIVFSSVEKYIGKGKKSFIIYPYGSRGKMVEKVLSESFKLHNYIIADNYCRKEGILSADQLKDYADDYILLLCSDNPAIYQDIRKDLKDMFHGEICDLAEIDSNGDTYEPFHFACSKMQIEEVNSEQMKQIFKKTKRAWEKLGKEEPYFSVITHDEMKTENITDQIISEFFLSGNANAMEIVNTLKRNGLENAENLDILELGCGCGRITKSLVQNFRHVNAVDISEGNLKIAKEHIDSSNVEFFLIKEVEDYMNLPRVDVVYSLMVLQHNSPPVIEYILDTMMSKLNVGGMLMFQVPTYYYGYSFVYDEYIKLQEGMEMHCFPQKKIFELAYKHQCIPLEIYPCLCTGRMDNSTMFIFKKIG